MKMKNSQMVKYVGSGCLGYILGLLTLPAIALIIISFDNSHNREKLLTERQCMGCNLSEMDLRGVDLRASNLQRANLRNSRLNRAWLRQANLSNTDFSNADLSGADFSCGAGSCTVMGGAKLTNANLTGALFQCMGASPKLDCDYNPNDTVLMGVDFTGANLTDADFTGTSLKGAITERAKFCRTKMPDKTVNNQDC